jgi:choline dehydrogenase
MTGPDADRRELGIRERRTGVTVHDAIHDVIVVGGGAAGSALAARLSEDPRRSVLLVGAGADAASADEFPADVLDASVMTAGMPGRPSSWAFPGRLTPERAFSVARGKILGGSTAVNGGYFIRARRHDFDRWVAAGNDEWSFEKCLPFYQRAENDLDYGDTEGHSSTGPIRIRRETENPSVTTTAFYAAAAELGFPEEPDKNAQGTVGYGPIPLNVVDGVRQNTGMVYVNPVRNRVNLRVQGGTHVLRVVFDGRTAVGVEAEVAGRVELIRGRQVVLAAGAIGSPHILMLSGIGPADELARVGVRVLHDAPGVGSRFTDHPSVTFTWTPRRRLDEPGLRQFLEGVLHFTSRAAEVEGDLEILPLLKPMRRLVPGATQQAAKYDDTTRDDMSRDDKSRDDMAFLLGLQHADARGTLSLTATDPHVPPILDYHYLDSERDRARMRELIWTAAALVRTRALEPYVETPTGPDESTLADDDLLDGWARTHLGTSLHTAGTARMGRPDDARAVVDQHGRVRGVQGLRIADLSILPDVPSRGPAATAVMIGEKVADEMRAEAAGGA